MGAGHAYPYRHFMLIDMDFFMFEEDNTIYHDEIMYDNFLHDLTMLSESYPANEWDGSRTYFAETEKVMYGIDHSGGMPCIVAYASSIDDDYDDRTDEEKWEEISEEVAKAFNEFIELYPNVFRRATSAWTSELYKQY